MVGLDGLLPQKEHFLMDGGNKVCSLIVSCSGGGLWRCNGKILFFSLFFLAGPGAGTFY